MNDHTTKEGLNHARAGDQGGTTPGLRTKMDRIVTDELIPALRDGPGFDGALNVVDREHGNGDDPHPVGDRGAGSPRALRLRPGLLQALATVTAITPGNRQPMSVCEVNARE